VKPQRVSPSLLIYSHRLELLRNALHNLHRYASSTGCSALTAQMTAALDAASNEHFAGVH